jgi:hypothetical protein
MKVPHIYYRFEGLLYIHKCAKSGEVGKRYWRYRKPDNLISTMRRG